jgi:ABC-type branched-subunit amino acid transport system ATPase component
MHGLAPELGERPWISSQLSGLFRRHPDLTEHHNRAARHLVGGQKPILVVCRLVAMTKGAASEGNAS